MAIDSGAQSKAAAPFGKQDFGIDDQSKLQQVLAKKLGPSLVSQRPSSTEGQRVAFVETWKLISLANELFGFNGWSNSITSQTIDYVDEMDGRYHVGVSACVRVTLKDGAYHEELGYGVSEGLMSKGFSIEKARKEAVSDGLKRSLRHFGNALGNCLGDKVYLQWVVNASDARPASSRKSSDSLLSGLVTSAQMAAPPTPAPAPVASASSQTTEAKQQPQQQQVLQVQLPQQAPALQAQRLPGPFQQQLPILQPIALATGTGGLNTSSAQQLFFVRPMSQAGLSPGLATLAAIPTSGLQTLTALPSSSLHSLTQLAQHPQLAQPAQLAQPTQLQHPNQLSQAVQLSQPSHLTPALQQASTQSAVFCSQQQQQAQHIAPVHQSVQSVLTQHQPKTSITQAVNQIKTFFNKNKQPIFSTCPAPLNSCSISSNLPCIPASSCATSASVSSSSNSMQSPVHGGTASSLPISVVTAVSSGVLQNGVAHTKALNVNTPPQVVGQSMPNNNMQCLNSNIKVIQNRYQGKVRSNVPASTYGHVRDIQPRVSSQATPQHDKVNSNSSDSSDQSRPRLRVVCPPLESESQHQAEEPSLPLSKKKRARSRSIPRAGNDAAEKTSPNNRGLPRAVKKACIPLVTIHCPFEGSNQIDIKQEKMDYDDAVPNLVYPAPLNKCEVVIESSYSLSSKEDEASLASEKANDGDDEDEDDESATVAKAMNTLFREGIRGQDSDFDHVSDHLLKEAGKARSPLKFSADHSCALYEDSARILTAAAGESCNQSARTELHLPVKNEERGSSTFSSPSSPVTRVISNAQSQGNKNVSVKESQQKIKDVPELSPKKTASEAIANNCVNKIPNASFHSLKNETLINTDTERTSQHRSVNFSVLDSSGDIKTELGKKHTISVVLDHSVKQEVTSSVEKNDQNGDVHKDSNKNTKCEIKSASSKMREKSETNPSNRKRVINNHCLKSRTNNFGPSLKSKRSRLSAGAAAKRSGTVRAAMARATEDTIGASLARAEKALKAKEGSSKSKTDASKKSKPHTSPVAETEGFFNKNTEAISKVKAVSESVAKTETSSQGKTNISPQVQQDDSSQEKADASSAVNTTILSVTKAILNETKIDPLPCLKAGAISSSTVGSASISEAEVVSKINADTITTVETNVLPCLTEANISARAVDELKVKSDSIAAANSTSKVELVTTRCRSPAGEKLIIPEDFGKTTDEVVVDKRSEKHEGLHDAPLPPSLCDAQRVEEEDLDAAVSLPALHASEESTFEDLFETINSPPSDSENSFMGFTDAAPSSVPIPDNIALILSDVSHVKSKSAKQNWKFKFRVRESSAINIRPKKVSRTSTTSPAAQSSASFSPSRSLPRSSSSGKKPGSDSETTRSSLEPSSVRADAPEMSNLASPRDEPFLTEVGPSQTDGEQLPAEGNRPLTPAAEEADPASPQDCRITPENSSGGSMSPIASESSRRGPLSQPDTTDDDSKHVKTSTCVHESVRTSVTAIITEDVAVTSLSTLVTNGSLLPSPDASPSCNDETPSPTLGGDCGRERLAAAPTPQRALGSDRLNCADLDVKKEMFKNSESGEINCIRKFESVVNGDVR